jgi:hypothetical protein
MLIHFCKVSTAVRLWALTRNVFGTNTGGNIGFNGFPQSLQANNGISTSIRE